MQLTDDYREKIQLQILDALVPALENGKLTESEIPHISEFVVSQMKSITTHQELIAFLSELASRWPVLSSIGNTEMGRAIEENKNVIVDDVIARAKTGDIDGALQLARNFTTN